MEAVTTRGSFALFTLYMLLVAGSASATAPLPPMEHVVGVDDREIGYVRDGIVEKVDGLPETCIGRELFCVGPFDPDIDMSWGTTGARVVMNDTYVWGGHDPARHRVYGPFQVPLMFDEFRICHSGCNVPAGIYGGVAANVTVYLYLGDEDGQSYSYNASHTFVPVQPGDG